ncbi:hypothetical protein CBA19CS22_14670 [Caballeronia novacaledonica]|uniref:Uncharacterized protein n=1 Tax=Caballeronia novacaledonica TaxID=1544861 RepID=A0ACB5QSJ3_9BURK|nr:hypothetical protein CBA19CS22_14670 [Caballeronia novacaledonica]
MRKTAVAPLCGKRRRALCIKRLIVLSGLQTILVAAPCPAESLPELLQEAAQHDAKFASADAQFRAAIQKEPEARAALLPHLGLSQSVFGNGIFVPGKSPESYPTLGTSLSLNQAVFKWDDWQSYQEGKLSAISAGLGLAAARQDLLLRTTQAYFDALAAQDQHVLAREHVRTLEEQLAISQRGFNLGTATIVDLNEAQAGADAAQSDLVHASAEVLKRYAAIEKIVAHPVTDVDAFAPDLSAPAIGADGADHWADTAQRESFDVRQQEIALEIAMREVSTSDQSLGIAKQELQVNEQLRTEGYVTETKMMELRRAAADYQSRQQSDTAELIRSRQRQTDLTLKIASLRNDYVKSADTQLKECKEKTGQIEEQLRPARDMDARTRIVAPVAGEVVGLRVHTIGEAIGPRDPILDLVPSGTPLIVEAKIKPDYVREIAIGSEADVRLTAYNPRTSPVLEGKVAYLSADSLADRDNHQQFYVARVEISAQALARANRLAKEPVVLGPGLRAEVFIRTRTRSAFDYLLEPIRDGIQRSMRD